MKTNRVLPLALGILLALSLTACSGANPPSQGSSSMESSSQSSSSQPDGSGEPTPPSRPMVADAALYRGTISEINDTGYLLTAAPGTNFGKETLTVTTDENTNFATPKEELNVGDYVEIYYGASPAGGPVPEPVSAITLARLSTDWKLVLFNGKIAALDLTPTEGNPSLLLEEENGNQVLFWIGEETQVYCNLENLKMGDQMNVFYSGVLTRSLPGQGTALELRRVTAAS